MSAAPPSRTFLAATAPGLAPLCAAELSALGLVPTATDEAGVTFDGRFADGARAALWLRTASRVLMRLASFEARGFAELEKKARTVPWADVVAPGVPIQLRVTCRKSKLYHTDAVAERVADAIRRATGHDAPIGAGRDAADDADDDAPAVEPQVIVVRFLRDRCTISADLSGALLHRRGYRLATAKAPMRETLAAALLLAAGYDGSGPLLDPLCGSGTIAIEGALIARRVAPGLSRSFAFERWPLHRADAWARIVAEARAQALPRAPHAIVASDRDAGAITAARANAERAQVLDDIAFAQAPVSALAAPDAVPGWLVTNPPYGIRVGEAKPLRDLHAALGRLARERLPGWHVGIVTANPQLAAALQLPLTPAVATRNGGLPVRFLAGRVPEAS